MHILDVLLADDEQLILNGLRALYDWEKNGYRIVGEATDGINAVNMALEAKPDLMLLDINMPLLSGFEVIHKLEALLPNTKYIIVSGYDDYKLLRTALKLHTFDYLLKPLHQKELAETLLRAREEIFDQKQLASSSENALEDIPFFTQMTTYLDNHFSEKITLSLLSSHFNMNPDYISSYFKRKSGMNFSDYLNSKRIAEAKKLLRTTDLSIGIISERVGFSNYRYFNKVFQSYLHIAPSQYRIEHQSARHSL